MPDAGVTPLVHPPPGSALRFRAPLAGRRFTLLEVLIAIAILGVSVALILSILAGARSRILRAERNWARQHLMAQAAEWYLLAGVTVAPPNGLMPPGFAARAELVRVTDLPVEAQDPLDGWVLGRFIIHLTGRSGENLGDLPIDKLVREDAL